MMVGGTSSLPQSDWATLVKLMAKKFEQIIKKNLSQIVFEWQRADRLSLLSLFILFELLLHFIWFFIVWLSRSSFESFVNLPLLPNLLLLNVIAIAFFLWLLHLFNDIKGSQSQLWFWQWVLCLSYTLYIGVLMLMIGLGSLFTGISLVGGAVLGMMLMNRRIIWRTLCLQILLVIGLTFLPYFGLVLPSLRLLPPSLGGIDTFTHLANAKVMLDVMPENVMATPEPFGTKNTQIIFWQLTYIFFSLPKALFVVHILRILLATIDKNKKKIQYYADHDILTGIKNRRCILKWIFDTLVANRPQTEMALRYHDMQLESETWRETSKNARNKNTELDNKTPSDDYSVILLDLDYFKAFNDSYGHLGGDKILKTVAEVLYEQISDAHAVSRYGGEEFLLALPKTSHNEAMQIAEDLRQKIADTDIEIAEAQHVNIKASFGVASLKEERVKELQQHYQKLSILPVNKDLFASSGSKAPSEDQVRQQADKAVQSLIDLADNALYQAKRQGRNRVVSANQLVDSGVLSGLSW